MKKTLIFMRTHIVTEAVLSEFLKLKNSNCGDCVLFIDNHTHFINSPNGYQKLKLLDFDEEFDCFLFDEEIFETLDLPLFVRKNMQKNIVNEMWHCADYVFYLLRKAFPNYEYYWQFEFDVFCNGEYEKFFEEFENSDDDLIVDCFDNLKNEPDWCWLKNSDWAYKNVEKYKSFFPVARLSGAATDFLYQRRLAHKELFSKIPHFKNDWIYCEMFVPTELMNGGYKCKKLDGQYLSIINHDLNESRVFESPDNKLYHPVKGGLNKLIRENRALKRFSFVVGNFRLGVVLKRERK